MKKQAYKYVFAINLDLGTVSGLTYDDVLNALHHLALKSFSFSGFSNMCICELSLSKKLVRTTFENNFFKVLNCDKVLPDHSTVFYAADTKAFDNCFSNVGNSKIYHYRAPKPPPIFTYALIEQASFYSSTK